MKHLYKLSLLLLALLIPATALAHDFEVDGIYYNFNCNEVTVTYKGTYYDSYDNEYTGDVTIPATVTYNGISYSVTSIGNDTFYNCSGLTSVTIPNSVTSIGDGAFSYCTVLTSIQVESGNPCYDSRNSSNAIIETASNKLIAGCKNTIIPNSVTSIGWGAFLGRGGLTSITIPNSVTSIGSEAFYGCSGLTSITIPNSVTSIGYDAFNGTAWFNNQPDGLIYAGLVAYKYKGTMPNGTSINLRDGTLSITAYAFSRCSGLTSIEIPNSVTTIGDYAFYYCTSLTSIEIPNSVTSIGGSAFVGTAWYNNQPDGLVYAGFMAYKYKGTMPSNTSITLKEGTVGIANNAFYNCSGLTSITIPNSVTTISINAFYGCSALTNITLPNSVISIGFNVFSGCSGLTSIVVASGNPKYDSRGNCNAINETASNTLIVGCKNTTIPNSITMIGDAAFNRCSSLTSIDIPNSVTSIGSRAFSGCSSLTVATIGNSVTSIGYAAFYGCTGLTSITIGNSVTNIGNSAFEGCSGLTSITIPNSVTSIGNGAFLSCSGLTSIVVANGNTTYDSHGNCNAIIETASNTLILGCKNTFIPNSVTFIRNWAFYGCSGLTSIIIPNSVTTIGGSAFYGCSGLTSVIIGNSVTSIGDGAFYRCDNLSEVFCLPLTPLTIDESAFYPCCSSAIFYVPDIALDAYKVAEYWKDFINIIGIPYTFEVDGTSYHATTMNTASVMANNDGGILYNGDVVIPDSVTYAGTTFAVTGIESNAFDGCFELTNVVIPNSIETIGEQAFQGCTGLTSVTIGSGVTAIGAKAFNYCNALETVKCIGTVPPVMASTDCFTATAYNRATLLVPRQQIEAYQAADYWYKFAHIDGWGSAGRGDIDGDGEVSIRDVTTMIDAILTGEHEGVYFESADLNSNGRLDIGDVTTIIDMLLNGE